MYEKGETKKVFDFFDACADKSPLCSLLTKTIANSGEANDPHGVSDWILLARENSRPRRTNHRQVTAEAIIIPVGLPHQYVFGSSLPRAIRTGNKLSAE